ncbi:hypothetical protein BZG36_04989 [Bifiguratus adelaidae]|uniref:Cytochrome b5 heme-binding domain-containing protein n=1 Tax=Bifiguratus adelaidae TaxID=1938954 RepID=A0A261XUE9_9FUNG|nr:hypothetical protein BZG36_04989 [Bifiguratus adelaidae]
MSEVKTLTAADVAGHTTRGDIWVSVHGKVYNVTNFLEEHPGGEEVLLDEAGKDATEAFEDVGHSDEARELLKTFYVADLKVDPNAPKKAPASKKPIVSGSVEKHSSWFRIVLPIAVLGGWLAYRAYQQTARH